MTYPVDGEMKILSLRFGKLATDFSNQVADKMGLESTFLCHSRRRKLV